MHPHVLIAALMAISVPVCAQTPREIEVVRPMHASNGADYGRSVAMSAAYAAVGAPGIDSVTVFERSGGELLPIAELPSPAGDGVGYGAAVAIDGDLLLVGAPGQDTTHPAAFLYQFSDGSLALIAQLSPPFAFKGLNYGATVALRDGIAVVGAPGGVGVAGRAVVFEHAPGAGWSYAATLLRELPAGEDLFGFSSTITDDAVIVGAPGTREVIHFEKTAGDWLQTDVLTGDGSPEYGFSCATQGSLLVVGERGGGFTLGKAYIYRRAGDTWQLQTTIADTFGGPSDLFATSVAVSDDEVVAVGAPGDRFRIGAVVIFRIIDGRWTRIVTISHFDGRPNDRMGDSVTIRGNALLIGVPRDRGDVFACFDRLPPCRIGSARLYRICLATLQGDANSDGDVDLFDVNSILVDYGLSGPGLVSDLNNDGRVDFGDLVLTLAQFGETCFD